MGKTANAADVATIQKSATVPNVNALVVKIVASQNDKTQASASL